MVLLHKFPPSKYFPLLTLLATIHLSSLDVLYLFPPLLAGQNFGLGGGGGAGFEGRVPADPKL